MASAIAELLVAAETEQDRTSLIWIDSADVQTTRELVHLAEASGAVMHVAQSTGAEVVGRVMRSEGWLGTSLAEVAQHADLVITLGDCVLSEAPLLAERFLAIQPDGVSQTQRTWFHISEHVEAAEAVNRSLMGTKRGLSPVQCIVLPKREWFAALTSLAMAVRTQDASHVAGETLECIFLAMTSSINAAWLWENSQFVEELDELLLRRLAAIARYQAQRSRCALLGLDANVGRVTAEETLLWMTGCSTTAECSHTQSGSTVDSDWHTPEALYGLSLDEWSQRFPRILQVHTVPSLSPPADLPAQVRLLAAESGESGSMGHLFRGDRASVLTCRSGSALPAASETISVVDLLRRATALMREVHGRTRRGTGESHESR